MAETVERLVAEVDVSAKAATAELKKLHAQIESLAKDRTAEVEVTLETKQAMAEARILVAKISAMDADITVGVDRKKIDMATKSVGKFSNSAGKASDSAKDATRSSSGWLKSLVGLAAGGRVLGNMISIIKIPAFISAGNLAATAVQALGAGVAALIQQLSSMTGVLAALPGLLSAVAVGAGVVLASFSGIGAAITGFGDQAKGVGGGGGGGGGGGISASAQAATPEATADRAVERENIETAGLENIYDASRNVEDARRNLADSNYYLKKSEDDLAAAHEEAKEIVDDLRIASAALAVQQMEGQARVADARKMLQATRDDPGAPARDLRDAKIALAAAEADLSATQEERKDVTDELAKREKEGVKNSEEVRDAQRNLKEEEQRRTDAVRDLDDALKYLDDTQAQLITDLAEFDKAERDLLSGTDDLTGGGGGGGGISALNEALANLGPNATAFAQYVGTVTLPALTDLRKAIQEAFFPDVTVAAQQFTEKMVPALTPGLVKMGETMGAFFGNLMATLTSDSNLPQITFLTNESVGIMESLSEATSSFADGMLDLMVAAAPLAQVMAEDIAGAFERFSGWAKDGNESGRLTKFFAESYETLKQWGRILGTLGSIFKDVGTAAKPLGKWIANTWEGGLKDIKEWTSSEKGQNSMAEWFDGLKKPLKEIGRLARDVTKALGSEMGDNESFTEVIRLVRTELLPALVDLFDTASQSFAPKLIEMLSELAGVIGLFLGHSPALDFFMGLLTGFFKILNKIGENKMAANVIASIATVLGILTTVQIGAWMAKIFAGGILNKWNKFVDIMKYLKVLMVSHPILLLLAAIAIAAYLIWKNWDKIKPLLLKFWDAVTEAWDKAFSWVKETWAKLWNWIKDNLGTWIGQITKMFGGIWRAIKGVWKMIKGVFTGDWAAVWEGAKEVVGGLWDAITGYFMAGIALIWDILKGLGPMLWQVIQSAWDGVINFMKGVPMKIWNVLLAIGEWVLTNYIKMWKAYINFLKDVLVPGIVNWVKKLPGKIWNALVAIGTWVKDNYMNVLRTYANFIRNTLIPLIVKFFQKLPERMWNAVRTIGTFLKDKFLIAWRVVTDWLRNTAIPAAVGFFTSLPGKLGNAFGAGFNFIKNTFGTIKTWIWNRLTDIKNWFVNLPDKLSTAFGAGFTWLSDLFEGAVNAIIAAWNSLDFEIGPFEIPSWVPFGYGGQTFHIEDLFPDIDELAMGDVIERRTIAVIGEAGPEAIIPLTRPKRAMELMEKSGLADRVREQSAKSSGTGGNTFVINGYRASPQEIVNEAIWRAKVGV